MPIVPLTGSKLRKRKIEIQKFNLIVSVIGVLFSGAIWSVALFVDTNLFVPMVIFSVGTGFFTFAVIYYATRLIQAYRMCSKDAEGA